MVFSNRMVRKTLTLQTKLKSSPKQDTTVIDPQRIEQKIWNEPNSRTV